MRWPREYDTVESLALEIRFVQPTLRSLPVLGDALDEDANRLIGFLQEDEALYQGDEFLRRRWSRPDNWESAPASYIAADLKLLAKHYAVRHPKSFRKRDDAEDIIVFIEVTVHYLTADGSLFQESALEVPDARRRPHKLNLSGALFQGFPERLPVAEPPANLKAPPQPHTQTTIWSLGPDRETVTAESVDPKQRIVVRLRQDRHVREARLPILEFGLEAFDGEAPGLLDFIITTDRGLDADIVERLFSLSGISKDVNSDGLEDGGQGPGESPDEATESRDPTCHASTPPRYVDPADFLPFKETDHVIAVHTPLSSHYKRYTLHLNLYRFSYLLEKIFPKPPLDRVIEAQLLICRRHDPSLKHTVEILFRLELVESEAPLALVAVEGDRLAQVIDCNGKTDQKTLQADVLGTLAYGSRRPAVVLANLNRREPITFDTTFRADWTADDVDAETTESETLEIGEDKTVLDRRRRASGARLLTSTQEISIRFEGFTRTCMLNLPRVPDSVERIAIDFGTAAVCSAHSLDGRPASIVRLKRAFRPYEDGVAAVESDATPEASYPDLLHSQTGISLLGHYKNRTLPWFVDDRSDPLINTNLPLEVLCSEDHLMRRVDDRMAALEAHFPYRSWDLRHSALSEGVFLVGSPKALICRSDKLGGSRPFPWVGVQDARNSLVYYRDPANHAVGSKRSSGTPAYLVPTKHLFGECLRVLVLNFIHRIFAFDVRYSESRLLAPRIADTSLRKDLEIAISHPAAIGPDAAHRYQEAGEQVKRQIHSKIGIPEEYVRTFLIPEAMAIAAAALQRPPDQLWPEMLGNETEETRRLMVLDVGAGTMDICVVDFAPNKVRSYAQQVSFSVPMGGNELDRCILRDLQGLVDRHFAALERDAGDILGEARLRILKELLELDPLNTSVPISELEDSVLLSIERAKQDLKDGREITIQLPPVGLSPQLPDALARTFGDPADCGWIELGRSVDGWDAQLRAHFVFGDLYARNSLALEANRFLRTIAQVIVPCARMRAGVTPKVHLSVVLAGRASLFAPIQAAVIQGAVPKVEGAIEQGNSRDRCITIPELLDGDDLDPSLAMKSAVALGSVKLLQERRRFEPATLSRPCETFCLVRGRTKPRNGPKLDDEPIVLSDVSYFHFFSRDPRAIEKASDADVLYLVLTIPTIDRVLDDWRQSDEEFYQYVVERCVRVIECFSGAGTWTFELDDSRLLVSGPKERDTRLINLADSSWVEGH